MQNDARTGQAEQAKLPVYMPRIMSGTITLSEFDEKIGEITGEIKRGSAHLICGIPTVQEFVDLLRIRIASATKEVRPNIFEPVMSKAFQQIPELSEVLVKEYPATLQGVKSEKIFRGSVSCTINVKLKDKLNLKNKFGKTMENVDTLKMMVRVFIDPGVTTDGVIKFAEYKVGKKAAAPVGIPAAQTASEVAAQQEAVSAR